MIIDIKETARITPKSKRKNVAIGDVIRFVYMDGSEERYVVVRKLKGIQECQLCHMKYDKELSVRMCSFSDMMCTGGGYLIRVAEAMEEL
jgi:hypothetical protein